MTTAPWLAFAWHNEPAGESAQVVSVDRWVQGWQHELVEHGARAAVAVVENAHEVWEPRRHDAATESCLDSSVVCADEQRARNKLCTKPLGHSPRDIAARSPKNVLIRAQQPLLDRVRRDDVEHCRRNF
jgi:hypothetical protein